MSLTYSHIQITAIPQLIDEEFGINMAEADRQIALAMSAPDLLAERDRLLQANAELVAALETVTGAYARALEKFGPHEWGMLTVEVARAAITKAEKILKAGKPVQA